MPVLSHEIPLDPNDPIDIEKFKSLLDRNPELLDETYEETGEAPLMTACIHGRLELVELFLERGAKLDQRSKISDTCLDIAVSAWLRGLESNSDSDPISRTPIGKLLQVVEYIIDYEKKNISQHLCPSLLTHRYSF